MLINQFSNDERELAYQAWYALRNVLENLLDPKYHEALIDVSVYVSNPSELLNSFMELLSTPDLQYSSDTQSWVVQDEELLANQLTNILMVDERFPITELNQSYYKEYLVEILDITSEECVANLATILGIVSNLKLDHLNDMDDLLHWVIRSMRDKDENTHDWGVQLDDGYTRIRYKDEDGNFQVIAMATYNGYTIRVELCHRLIKSGNELYEKLTQYFYGDEWVTTNLNSSLYHLDYDHPYYYPLPKWLEDKVLSSVTAYQVSHVMLYHGYVPKNLPGYEKVWANSNAKETHRNIVFDGTNYGFLGEFSTKQPQLESFNSIRKKLLNGEHRPLQDPVIELDPDE